MERSWVPSKGEWHGVENMLKGDGKCECHGKQGKSCEMRECEGKMVSEVDATL